MKRILMLSLALILLLSLAACARVDRSGEFLVYEGKVLDVDAPTGDNTILLRLKGGLRVYTTDETLCFDASDRTYTRPQWRMCAPGDRIRVWASKARENGGSEACCILTDLEGGHDGGFFRVNTVEEADGRLVFTDTDGTARVTVARDKVYDGPELLVSGATCFAWYAGVADGRPANITADYVRVVTSPAA